MLQEIGEAIEQQLKALNVFKVVERSITKKAIQSPPSAAFYLFNDKDIGDWPVSNRSLTWEIVLMVNALSAAQGQNEANAVIDTVRDAFFRWKAVESAGIEPAKIVEVKLEGLENNLLVYAAKLEIRVKPVKIQV